jgi:excisionase family DNA binding protein
MRTRIPASLGHHEGGSLRDEDVLLTRREAANYLRVSVPTLERWSREGGSRGRSTSTARRPIG